MIERIALLPRWARIALVGLIALLAVLAIFSLVDRIYINFLYTPDTVVLPSYFSVAVGLVMYVWGWLLFVGTRGDKLIFSSRRIIWVYLVIALLAIAIDVALVIQGIFMTDIIAG